MNRENEVTDISILFWSSLGEVACRAHAPLTDSERWRAERWASLPTLSRRGIEYQCQHCSDTLVRHVRRRPARSSE